MALGIAAAPAASDDAFDPYAEYLALHPEESEDSLLDPNLGDSIERALAVLYHPQAGFSPHRLAFRSTEPGSPALDLAGFWSLPSEAKSGSWLIRVTPTCPTRWQIRSWMYVRAGELRAYRLTPYAPNCEPGVDLVETSDHEAMAVVGTQLFRPNQRGSFVYGALHYERWDEAFAAPTDEAMLSMLEAGVRAARNSAGARNRFAVGLYAFGRRDDAIEQLRKAAELSPRWARPLENLAVVLRLGGDREAADAAAREARDRLDAEPQKQPSFDSLRP